MLIFWLILKRKKNAFKRSFFIVRSSKPKWLQADFFPYENGDGKRWYVEMETRHIGTLMSIILFAGMAVYVTLFTIWATVNAYNHRRLNIGWVFVFALLNIVGYLIYFLVGKRKISAWDCETKIRMILFTNRRWTFH